MKSKKLLSVMLLSMLLSVSALSGCSGGKEEAKPSGSEGNELGAQEQVTITVWDNYGATTPIKPLIPKFEEEFPNIKVDFQEQPWDNFWDKMAAAASGGETPDIATSGLMWNPKYTVFGLFADLNSLSGGKVNGQDIQAVYSEGMIEAATTDQGLFGIPYDFDSYSLYYRSDLLEEAGVSVPPSNWDELVEIGKKLTKDLDGDGKTDQYAFLVMPDWYHFEPFLYANGGKVLTDDNKQAAFNSPEGVEALQFYADLVNKHKIGINWTPDRGSYVAGLKDGTIAMFQDGPYVMGLIKNSNPEQEGKWRITDALSHKQYGTHIGGTYLSIFEKSEHKEEAWKFIEFLSREENAIQVYKTSGAAPGYLPALDSKEVNSPDPFFGNEVPMEVFKKAVENGKPNPIVSSWQEISQTISDAVVKVVMNEATPQEALDEAAEQVNLILAQE
ncbi:sugar ABC transporter substrate-binding protein [Paenibacillus sp. p3-SID1389]|uniref:ABC transporter substrate-binding protein n=1 Tax=Paenibacillus sp. p3-SID1389 TaxID=2916364 RepID=UPI0021A90AAE|nr:sugar ABC transporter substrate-binding protein [Paenibacillus sp. p3-SID1389]MCT2195557.1 sugar ABC transporter substrate-binding protein [Paenibacillus sp. p3-SID1389]